MSHMLLVITGPSGAGIREVVDAVFAQRSDVGTVVPVTARKKKEGETDGLGFFFYDLDEWNRMKETGDLLESTEFAGNDYGTSRRLVLEQLAAGRHVLLRLELERASQLKRNMPEAVCVYVEPSEPVLEERFRARSRSALECAVRLREAARQRALSGFCDARVNSDDAQAAARELCVLLDR